MIETSKIKPLAFEIMAVYKLYLEDVDSKVDLLSKPDLNFYKSIHDETIIASNFIPNEKDLIEGVVYQYTGGFTPLYEKGEFYAGHFEKLDKGGMICGQSQI